MSFCDNSRLAGTASDFSKRSFGLSLLRLDARKRDDCNVGEIFGHFIGVLFLINLDADGWADTKKNVGWL